MADIYTLSLSDITPQNLTDDPEISRIISALDPTLQSLTAQSATPLIIPRIESVQPEALDALAVQFHADMFGLAQDEDAKRQAVISSLTWHMRKGTPSAIIDALKHAGVEAEFVPWWKFGGFPYTFRINAKITGDFYRTKGKDNITRIITTLINDSKSARSLMADLNTTLSFSENSYPHAGLISLLSGYESIRLQPPEIPQSPQPSVALIPVFHGNISVYIHRDRNIMYSIYTASVSYTAGSFDIGVDLDTMQELLLQFEKRLFNRIYNLEYDLNTKIDAQYQKLDAKIDSVIEMLRWKGADESL